MKDEEKPQQHRCRRDIVYVLVYSVRMFMIVQLCIYDAPTYRDTSFALDLYMDGFKCVCGMLENMFHTSTSAGTLGSTCRLAKITTIDE